MPTETTEIETLANREYKWGFVTDIEAESAPPGLNEEIVRFICHKKGEPQWMLDWRLKAYRHWLKMEEPHDWPKLKYPPIDYQCASYYSAPKPEEEEPGRGRSGAAGDLREARHPAGASALLLAGRGGRRGVRLASPSRPPSRTSSPSRGSSSARSSEAVREHPELVQKYLGSVVPYSDNFFATLNSAVFTRRQLRLHPQGRPLPDGAEHLLPHQRARTRASSSGR